jgi:hypothetical protein
MMMRTLFFFFLFIFGIHQTSYSQDLRAEADTFAMNMVRMLVTQHCDGYPALFNDTVYMLQKTQSIVKSEMGPKISIFCKAAIRDKSMTMESYLASFNRELLDANEIKTKKDLYTMIQAHPFYKLQENDFLFIGYRHKTDDYMKYILDDPFCVIFRKYEDGFRIVMLAGN